MQRYNIKIYDHKWNSLGRIYQPDILDITYEHRLSEAGSMTLSVLAKNKWANSTVLQKLNKIELLYGDVVIWNGIMFPTFGENVHTLECTSLLGLFDLDYVTRNIATNQYANIVANQVFAVSLDDNQGIEYGEISLSNPPLMSEEIGYVKISEALSNILQISNGEMKIGLDKKFYLLDNIGEDKSSKITFRFNQEFLSISNIKNTYQIVDDISEYANKVTGKSKKRVYYTVVIKGKPVELSYQTDQQYTAQNVTEIDKYGVVRTFVDFGTELDETTLQQKVHQELNTRIYNKRIENVEVLKDKVNFLDINVGDLVRVELKTKFYNINQISKITSIQNNISDSAENILTVGLTAKERNIAPLTFGDYLTNLNNRINNLEQGN
ncbi:MAG: hypothetical protein WC648_04090 [Candidatus Paceibacterota bacterium]|jgi:hypothetical protein